MSIYIIYLGNIGLVLPIDDALTVPLSSGNQGEGGRADIAHISR